MNGFKKMCGLLALVLTLLSTYAHASKSIPQDYDWMQMPQITQQNLDYSPVALDLVSYSDAVGTCTIHISTTLDNGTTIEGTVKIDGIRWYECLALKIKDLFSNDF